MLEHEAEASPLHRRQGVEILRVRSGEEARALQHGGGEHFREFSTACFREPTDLQAAGHSGIRENRVLRLPKADDPIGASFDHFCGLEWRAMGHDVIHLVGVVIPPDPAIAPAQIRLEDALGLALERVTRLLIDLSLYAFFNSSEFREG